MVTYEICTSIDGFYYYIKTRAQTLKSHPYSWIFAQHRLQGARKCIDHLPFSSASVVSIKNGRSSYFPFIHIAVKILHFRFDLHSVLGHLVTVRPMTPSWVVQIVFDPLSLLDVRFLEHEIYWITLSIPPTTVSRTITKTSLRGWRTVNWISSSLSICSWQDSMPPHWTHCGWIRIWDTMVWYRHSHVRIA